MIYALLFLFLPLIQPDSLKYIDSFGNFQEASSISTSREEFIFVSDVRKNQIYKFSETGEELASFGGSGFGVNELNFPVSIDASNGLDIFVCDFQNNRIQRYDIKLNYIATFSFNTYNLTSDNSQKIYYPYGIAFLNTSEIFVLADASAYKIAKLKSLDEVSLLFGSSDLGYERVLNPRKITRGANLDLWLLDTEADAVLNFDNYGTFVKKLTNPEENPFISIAYYKNNLYILNNKSLIIYDLKSNKFSKYYNYSITDLKNIKDISILKENIILILTGKEVHKYLINNLN